MVVKVPCFGSADAAYCFLLVKEGVELNQFRVMKVLKKKQTQICWNLNHYNWNDMKTSRKKILTFVVVQLVLLQLLEYEFLGAYSCLSKEAFENGIGAEDFLETGVDGDHGVGLGLLEED